MGVCPACGCNEAEVFDPYTSSEKISLKRTKTSEMADMGSWARKIYDELIDFRKNPNRPKFQDKLFRVYQDLVPMVTSTSNGSMSKLELIMREGPLENKVKL